MMNDRDEYGPGKFTDAKNVAGMKPFACSYDGPDGRYAITLYGTDGQQVLEDNCDQLPGLTIDGVLAATAPAIKKNTP